MNSTRGASAGWPKLGTDFNHSAWDASLARWLSDQCDEAERAQWRELMLSDAQFREALCDWLRSLREPGDAQLGRKVLPI